MKKIKKLPRPQVSAIQDGENLVLNGPGCCLLTLAANVLLSVGKDVGDPWLSGIARQIADRVENHPGLFPAEVADRPSSRLEAGLKAFFLALAQAGSPSPEDEEAFAAWLETNPIYLSLAKDLGLGLR